MTDEELLREEREARIAELEGRLARRSGVGVRAPVSILAIGFALFLFWQARKDVAYFFSSPVPITLGAEGDYHFDRLTSNRFAQIHGVPTRKGAYSRERDATRVVVGLLDTPLLVVRPTLPGEAWAPGTTPPVPNQSALGVRGRLLAESDVRRYKDAFAKLGAADGLVPHEGKLWLLAEGERPGRDFSDLVYPGVLVLFVLFNLWLLWRELRFRLRRLG